MHTRTGNFPIGFRRIRSPWQRDLTALIAWAKESSFSLIDLGPDADTLAAQITAAGLAIGSADLPDWPSLITPDAARRKDAIQKCAAYVQACSRGGIRNFFLVMLPADPGAPRQDNFSLMVDSLSSLAPTLAEHQAHLVIEGWPGPGALCCTPESLRATFRACPSPSIGLNFDPSHLIRMHIDPLRFLEEFAGRVYHVHGKDAEILGENLYTFGIEQPPTWPPPPRRFGSLAWRYCIPRPGGFNWTRALEILASRTYRGAICIELEDENFNGSEEGEKKGLLAAAHYLAAC